MRMELAKLADGLGMKPGMVGKGKIPAVGDFAFNDSDPEKMTATTSICMITITVYR
jgi:hypothetical protein